jgi:hypothetical protein
MATCTICETRKAKRYCTSRGEDICSQCCATEREVSINCPFSCSYLRESRIHEKRQLNEAEMPHPDVQIDAEFIQRAELVLMVLAGMFNRALTPVPNATDADAREALEALVASFRAAVAGQPEEVLPQGEVAAGIVARFRESVGEFFKELQNRDGGVFADTAILGVLVFMARVAFGHNNGRPHCRAYVHYLRETFPEAAQ